MSLRQVSIDAHAGRLIECSSREGEGNAHSGEVPSLLQIPPTPGVASRIAGRHQ